MADHELPSFDLVVATVDRVEELGRFLSSLERQTHPVFRVLLVDQNEDGRLDAVLAASGSLDVMRLSTARGLSQARNAALPAVRGGIVAFPDDDCIYPDDLLEGVARRFADDPTLDGVTGRAVSADGRSSRSWKRDAAALTRENLWNRAISFTIFLRAGVVARVGAFDEQLGLGSRTDWASGEEIDYLVRAIDGGARIEYDPELVVVHEDNALPPAATGLRDGASIGYILRKHRYPLATVARMFARPLVGALLSVARRDGRRARFHLSTLRGRLVGYRS
ncbi:MAG: glycosyltransferase family A protein [Gaiellaceae bacterium]